MPIQLEKLKADFIEKNAALLAAIELTTVETYTSFANKLLLSSLRI